MYASYPVMRRGLGESAEQARRILRAHAGLILLTLVYCLGGALLAGALGLSDGFSLTLYAKGVVRPYVLTIVLFAAAYTARVMLVERPKRLLRHLRDDLTVRYLTLERLLPGLTVLALLPFFFSAFTSFKMLIPWIKPYAWDQTFMAWDLWLHGGRHPWELLQPLLGTPVITAAINLNYHLWFFLLYAMIVWQAFALRDPHLRMRFFVTLFLCLCLLGSLAAIGFASAGPCYYGPVTGLQDPYAPLMDYLRQADESYPVWALGVQEMLWQKYQEGSPALGSGISAMPSVHVAVALLLALTGWRIDRRLGLALSVFAGLTLLGSVHLAWHYAVDGYASILATLFLWWAVGRLTRAR